MISQNTSKIKLWISAVDFMFMVHLLVVGLVVTGILPRAVVPFWTLILAVYVLRVPLEDATTFFVRSIPFFIAIPITIGFDSLNMWRVLSGLIFLKWLFQKESFLTIRQTLSLAVTWHREFHKRHKILPLLILLLILATLSMAKATSLILAIKRMVYFINLSLIGVVIHDLIRGNQNFSQRLIKNIAIPTIIVAIVGMLQLATTYFMDIFRFMDFWGGIVERNLFGNAWAETAIKANTWFAYFGNQLSLRMFSIFPDSHSFPIFLLLGLPSVMALALRRVAEKGGNLRILLKTRASVLVVFVPIIFLCLILTGTRGIWVAGLASFIMAVFLVYFHRNKNDEAWIIFKYVASYLLIFFLLFGVAYYIIASDQFMVQKDSTGLLAKRARSVIDISETSNARRIEIWKDSIKSIIKHPLLGVGIGNFPVVVGEDLARAKAGSSAHNLYLHIAAEMGIPALIFALWFFLILLKKIYRNFLETKNDKLEIIYFGSLLVFLPWILIYSLTDVAIFDERSFLLFVTVVSLVFSQNVKFNSYN